MSITSWSQKQQQPEQSWSKKHQTSHLDRLSMHPGFPRTCYTGWVTNPLRGGSCFIFDDFLWWLSGPQMLKNPDYWVHWVRWDLIVATGHHWTTKNYLVHYRLHFPWIFKDSSREKPVKTQKLVIKHFSFTVPLWELGDLVDCPQGLILLWISLNY